MQHCTKYSHPRKHLNFEDRLRFEKDWNRLLVHHPKKVTILGFAKKHGISTTLWRRELRRCSEMKCATVSMLYKVKGRVLYDYPLYNAEFAQAHAKAQMRNKGPRQRMTAQMADKISAMILNDKMSPYCAHENIKNADPDAYVPCWRTIYNYLDSGEMKAKRGDTPYHPGKLRRKKSKAHPARTVPGRKQISERPEGASARKEIGHWEMDTVTSCAGKKGGIVCLVDCCSRVLRSIQHCIQHLYDILLCSPQTQANNLHSTRAKHKIFCCAPHNIKQTNPCSEPSEPIK